MTISISNHPHNDTAFTPEQFNDPIAVQTKWSPIKKSSGAYQHLLTLTTNEDRLEFRVDKRALFFLYGQIFFLVLWAGVFLSLVVDAPFRFDGFTSDDILGIAGFLAFCFCFYSSTQSLLFGTKPIIFDRNLGLYWKGRKIPNTPQALPLKQITSLSKVHSIQLLPTNSRNPESMFYAYELNLILKDSDRLYIMNNNEYHDLHLLAKSLAQFLGVPLWNDAPGAKRLTGRLDSFLPHPT